MTPTLQLQKSYRYPGDEISWAGECPWTGGICFGTDKGNLILPDVLPGEKVARSLLVNRDTINGLAFGDGFVVASSPTEVTWLPLDGELQVVYAGGAHDVVALNPTLLLAPLGPNGILSLIRETNKWRVGIGAVKSEETCVYRICALPEEAGRCTVVGAGRTKGLILYECDDRGGGFKLSYRDFPGQDLVDVCQLPLPGSPDAIAAITSNRTLFVTRDVRNEVPTQLRVADLEGTGYTVKTIGGHLALLTSHALYVLADFVEKFAKGELRAPSRSSLYTLPVEASEVYVVYDEYVLLEMDDAIYTLQIDELINSARKPRSSRRTASGLSGGGRARGQESDHPATRQPTVAEAEIMPTAVSTVESPVRHLELAPSSR